MTSFVSQRTLDEKRRERKEQRRNAREEILRDAKEKFLREKRQKELRESRGDDVWVAAGVSARLGGGKASRPDSDEHEKKKKHDKKGKKHKRKKKHPRKEEEEESNSSEDEPIWVEKCADSAPVEEEKQPEDAVQQAPLVRDEWMKLPLAPSAGAMDRLAYLEQNSTASRQRRNKEECHDKRELSSFDRLGQHPLELNPYWKEGGCGLPKEEDQPPTASKTVKINDGGRSWLLRSYKRVLEKVEEEGVSIEEVAADRWGSLEELYSLLEEAGIDPKNPDKEPTSSRRDYLYSRFDHDVQERRARTSHDLDKGKERCGYSHIEREGNKRERPDFGRRDQSHHYSSSRASRETYFMKPRLSGGFMKPSENEDDSSNAHHHEGLGWKDGGLQSSQSWRKKQLVTSNKPTSTVGSTSSSTASSASSFEDHSLSLPTTERPCIKEKERDSIPSQPVTDSQLNALAAKVMKAELMGNSVKVDKLKCELERLRRLKQEQQSQSVAMGMQQSGASEKTIVLAKTDRFGRVMPVHSETGAKRDLVPPQKSRYDTHTPKGKRRKYFVDDDHHSLQDLVRQEMMMSAEDTRAAIARMASKFTPAANSEETVDDALDSKAMLRHDPQKEATKQKLRAMAESKKMTQILEECKLCFGNSGFEKHLLES